MSAGTGIAPTGTITTREGFRAALEGALADVEPDDDVAATVALGRVLDRFRPEATTTRDAARHVATETLEPWHGDAAKSVVWSAFEVAERRPARSSSEAPEGDGGERPDLGLRTLREILEDPKVLDPPEPVADRIAYRGYSTLLASREKRGKSTLACGAAAAVSTGSPWLGSPCTPGHVLYITLDESPKDTVRRLVSFGANPDRVTLLSRLVTPGDPLRDVRAAAEEVGPALIVVDTLAELVRDLSLDSGDAGAWTPVVGGLSRVARKHDAGLLLLHHTKKDGKEYRDSTAIGASVDLILVMSEGEPSDVRKLKAQGRLPVDGFSARLHGDPHDPDGVPRWELTSGELSLDARILLHVERHPGASTREVRTGVTGRTRDITAALERLLERGALVDRGTGSGRSLYAPDTGSETGSEGVGKRGSEPHSEPPPRSGQDPHGTATEPPRNRSGNHPRFRDSTPIGTASEPPREPGPEREVKI